MSGSDLSLSLHISYILLATQTQASQREVSGHQPGVHSQCLWALAFLCPSEQSSHGHGSRASSLGPWKFPFTTEHPLLLWSTWVASMAIWELLWVGKYWLQMNSLAFHLYLPMSSRMFFLPCSALLNPWGGWIGSSAKNGVNCPRFLCFPDVVSILVAPTEAPRHRHGGLSIISDNWYPGVYP